MPVVRVVGIEPTQRTIRLTGVYPPRSATELHSHKKENGSDCRSQLSKSNFMLFREIAQMKQVSQSRRHMQLASSRYWFLIQCFQNTLQQISTRPKCVSPPWLIPCGQPHIPQSHHGSKILCRIVRRHRPDTFS